MLRRNRKLGFLAVLLPLTGLVLIMPPLVLIASEAPRLLGIPSIVLYLFAVWFALIGGAFILQRHLQEKTPPPSPAVNEPDLSARSNLDISP